MNRRLDELLTGLAHEPPGFELAGLEADVARGIATRRLQAQQAARLAPVGVASVGMALAIGFAAGGATAAGSLTPQADVLGVSSSLAPSTLLRE